MVYLGPGTTTEFDSGAVLTYNDTWRFIKCTYNNGYWRIYVDDVDVSINTGVQHFISNHTDYHLSFITEWQAKNQYGAYMDIDEIKIYRG